MEQDSNLLIWNQVCKTDTKFTKTAEFQGRIVTSISGQYFIKRATEIFGPLGSGWGYEILENKMIQGAPIISNQGVQVGHELMNSIHLKLWYIQNEKRSELEQFGHTPFVYQTKYGVKTDFDAEKKSLTDAIKKCLSQLGFSADVFLGLFDDEHYLATQKTESDIAQANAHATAQIEFEDSVKEALDRLNKAPSANALRVLIPNERSKLLQRAALLGFDTNKLENHFSEEVQKIGQKFKRENCICGEVKPQKGEACLKCGVIAD